MKVRKFLQHIQGSLQIEEEYVLKPLQEQDQGIMDAAIMQGLSPTQLKHINACRLYLRVQYISELTTDTKFLPVEVQENTMALKDTRTKLEWPIQQQPGKKAWKWWQQMLRKMCEEDGKTLRKAIKNRWPEEEQQHQQWRYVHDINTNLLYDTQEMREY